MNGTDIECDSDAHYAVYVAELVTEPIIAAVHAGIDSVRDVGGCAVVVSCKNATVSLLTNDLVSVSKEGRDFSVSWTNATDFVGTLTMAATFYSETGAVIYSLEVSEEIAYGSSGTTTLKWPENLSNVRDPAILLISAKKTKSLMQAGTDAAKKAKTFGGKISGKGKALAGKAGKWFKRDGKDAESVEDGDSDSAEK